MDADNIALPLAEQFFQFVENLPFAMEAGPWHLLEFEDVQEVDKRKACFLLKFSNGKKYRVSVTEDRTRRDPEIAERLKAEGWPVR